MANTKAKFVAGTVIGAAAGAAAGVLLAPKSGKQTRKELGDKARSIGSDAKDLVETGKGKLTHIKNKAKGKAEQQRQKIYDKADQIERRSKRKI